MTRLPGDSLAVEFMPYISIFSPNGQFVPHAKYGPFAPGLLQSLQGGDVRYGEGSVIP